MAATFTRKKDPSAALDYAFDWGAEWLGAATIASATVTGPAGITVGSPVTTTTRVVARISGGTAGEDYPVVCHITSSSGEQDERTLVVQVRNR